MPYFKNEMIHLIKMAQSKVESKIYTPISELEMELYHTKEPVPFADRLSGCKRTIKVGEQWGELWDCAWFHFTGKLNDPPEENKYVLLIDISGEACVVDKNGCPIQGLTNVASDFERSLGKPGKRVYALEKQDYINGLIDLWADAGLNDLFGFYKDSGKILEASIAIEDEEMKKLYYDFEVLTDLLENLPVESARYDSILFALYDAACMLKYYTREEIQKARELLAAELSKSGGDRSLAISAIGHAHIDLAWLWPIRETKRKAARTFSTALRMMERYPDYVFGASQPQLYQWVKEDYPKLYEKVKEKVQEGRWECQGAMWVEADTNISGGEALIRQILYGKQFFREEFDKDITVCWLPDVFGYSGALPQLLKKSGVEYFMTTKLSWNKHNQHPHHTFLWKGIDGSEILAHMPPEGNYNSSAAPRALLKAEKNYLDKGVSDHCLLLFGIGDGGGGPWEDHLERLAREKDLNGLPPTKQEPSIKFFNALEKRRMKYKTWSGELYFEMHQGTLTTQAKNKWYNRRLEYMLRNLELVRVLAQMYADLRYPKEQIEGIWKELLLYQFHDILPGSSIKRVYDESLAGYEKLASRIQDLSERGKRALARQINSIKISNPAIVLNSLSWQREEWIEVKGCWYYSSVPSMGYSVINLDDHRTNFGLLISRTHTLENELIRVEFHEDGSLASVYDKELKSEMLEKDTFSNRLTVYEDEGDAWDFAISYDSRIPEYFKLTGTESEVLGPKAIVSQEYSYGSSRILQKIIITAGSKRIDFRTKVYWNETGKMLRTAFLTSVVTTEATCDIQFGNINRPSHRNTSLDLAKFEVCAHKWVDLSHHEYGVALLNDSKYGYKISDNVIDLNLLRSTCAPGKDADQGYHEFTYAIYPHKGDYIAGGVVREGYEFNIPLETIDTEPTEGRFKESCPFIEVDTDSVIIETVKQSEDEQSIVVRFYECHGSKRTANIHLNFDTKKALLTDLMENTVSELELTNSTFQLTFSPFEIHTVKLMVSKQA